MTGPDPRSGSTPGDSPVAGVAAVPAPRHMWWTYLLTGFALAVMGSGAGQALFLTRDLGRVSRTVDCLARQGVDPIALNQGVGGRASTRLHACTAAYNDRSGVAMLVGAGAVLLAAGLLTLCGGLLLRLRLRVRAGGQEAAAGSEAAGRAARRFEAWCDTWELTGRRRPRLLLAAPGRFGGRAFTTGVPLGRPVVVVPLSYAYLAPETFDVVVLHELAHVRSRDLLWAASVWWTGWLNVPVLLLALGSTLTDPGGYLAYDVGALGTAAALSSAVLVLRAALLRRRELAADRFAVEVMGDAGPLRTALGGRTAIPGAAGPFATALAQLRRGISRLTASHPPPEVRAAATPADPDRWEGGFALSAAAGLVAMFTYQGVYTLLVDLSAFRGSDPSTVSDLAFASTGLIWACVVVPAWARRVRASAPTGSAPSWRGPLAGALLGIVGGYVLQVPGAPPVTGRSLFRGHLLLTTGLLAVAVAGAAVLTLGLATRVAAGRRPLALASAVVTAAVALTMTLSTTVTLLVARIRWESAAGDRMLLVGLGDQRYWRYVPLLLLVGCALCAPRGLTLLPRRHWPVVAVVAAVGGLASALEWRLRIPAARRSGDATYLLLHGGWWICALAGWTALVAVLLTRADPPLPAPPAASVPTALTAGLLGAALAGLVRSLLLLAAGGSGATGQLFLKSVRVPPWMFLATVVVTLPWLLAGAGAARRRPARGRTAPRRGVTAPAAGIGVAVLAAALAAGLLSPLTVSAHDYTRGLAAIRSDPQIPVAPVVSAAPAPSARPRPTGDRKVPPPATPVPAPTPSPDPGRPLSRAAAEHAFDGLRALLPAHFKQVPNSEHSTLSVRPKSCQTLFDKDYAHDRALPRTADITRTYSAPAEGTTSSGLTITFTVTSYVTPQPGFTSLRREVARCPHPAWVSPGADDGLIHGTLTLRDLPGTPYPAVREGVSLVSRTNGITIVVAGSSDSEQIGHTIVLAEVDYAYFTVPPPRAVRAYPQALTAAALTTVVRNLRAAADSPGSASPPSHR
ncbi:M48 family metalloprotease [Streptomyces polygonati]|uniref:M48 family metalloprotease n=1 Tax=Streptomyces polygonati TaxID=1617087 RepID=A0ABV8HPK3_9ACTN